MNTFMHTCIHTYKETEKERERERQREREGERERERETENACIISLKQWGHAGTATDCRVFNPSTEICMNARLPKKNN